MIQREEATYEKETSTEFQHCDLDAHAVSSILTT
jgi:hypothetical protein